MTEDSTPAAMLAAGHNHHRTDGGPEWTGEEHDRWHPDCPLTPMAVAGQEGDTDG